jgi:hypothetical protein
MISAPVTCLHPLVANAGEYAQCRSCTQTFGLCEQHGIYPLVDNSGCQKCRAVGLGLAQPPKGRR